MHTTLRRKTTVALCDASSSQEVLLIGTLTYLDGAPQAHLSEVSGVSHKVMHAMIARKSGRGGPLKAVGDNTPEEVPHDMRVLSQKTSNNVRSSSCPL
eukprot:160412-Amphidinium_carterae.2